VFCSLSTVTSARGDRSCSIARWFKATTGSVEKFPVKRVVTARWPWVAGVAGIALLVAIVVPLVSGSVQTHPSAAKPATTPCPTVQSCQLQMKAFHHDKDVLVPAFPNLVFTSGWVENPHVEQGGFLGQIGYLDSSEGRILSYQVSTSPEWLGFGFLQGCESEVGTVLRTPEGRPVCVEEPKFGVERGTMVETVYDQGGVFYTIYMLDESTPSPTIWAQDRSWALNLVDSYR
jgi:hypothetical protein